MDSTIANLTVGEQGVIKEISLESIPLALLEMGCLPGENVELLHIAPLHDPLYIIVNGRHLAIRKATADKIKITKK